MNFATSKERLLQYLSNKHISVPIFLKETGIKRGFLDGDKLKASISDIFIAKIIAKYKDLNIEWLITGNGEMLNQQSGYKSETDITEVKEPKPHYESANYKPRPFIDVIYGTLGVPNGFALAVRADECEQISIPFISDYDFSIKGRGDSMINRKNPDRSICDSDLIACKLWKSRSHVQWGQVYALATSQGVIVKQIKESEKEGCIKCVSFNEEDGYSPYDIPVEEIYDWALVVSVTHTSKW